MNFSHLHIHDLQSILDGVNSPYEYTKKARELEQNSLAITNHGNIDSAIKFQHACNQKGVKPIFGCELYVVDNEEFKAKGDNKFHIVLLVKNKRGWKELCKILTHSNLIGFYKVPRIGAKALLSYKLDHFVVMSACIKSFLHAEWGLGFLDEIQRRNVDFYYEIMPHDFEKQRAHHNFINSLKRGGYDFPLVLTNDCHYTEKDGYKSQDLLIAIKRNQKYADAFKFSVQGLYMKSANEMYDAMKDSHPMFTEEQIKESIQNTQIITEKCNFKLERKNPVIPKPETDKKLTDILFESSRYKKEYQSRIDYEISIIKEKKFEDYFITIYEILTYCRNNDIPYGCGRGSVGGSIVAYLLYITDINPLKYNLFFDRFMNPERNDLPDIDLDISYTKREELKKYLEQKYKKVAGLSTTLKIKTKAALHDVGRVFNVPDREISNFTKNFDDFYDFVKENPNHPFLERYPDIIHYVKKIDGCNRAVGQHPSGIVVYDDSLNGNLCYREGKIVVNWDIEDSEYAGLVKFDFLGLNTVTILDEMSKKTGIDYKKLNLEDKKVYDEISWGNTAGIFQLSTYTSTDIAKKMQPANFKELTALLALARPGPLHSGMTDEYIFRKHGKAWEKGHRIYEEITKDTYGILCYQEQVMQIFNQMAGLPYSIADKIRKIIGKKRDVDEFEQYRKMFIDGCLEQKTYNEEEAGLFWQGLLEWASYGFNRAHSVGYAILAYACGFYKIYFPGEFLATSLTYTKTKKENLISEVKRLGIEIKPPKISSSSGTKWEYKNSYLYMPFIEMKGIGDKIASEIDLDNSFFNKKSASSNLLQKMKSAGVFDEETPKDINDYLDNPVFEEDRDIVIAKAGYKGQNISKCQKCDLHKECSQPVNTEKGEYNVLILGEAPGTEEDKKKKPFVGKAGKLLWEEMLQYDLKREHFYIANVCKCYPSETRTPDTNHIQACFPYTQELIKSINCQLILALGNTPLGAFENRKGGIVKESGAMKWFPEYNSYVVYCVHPAAVLRGNYLDLFEKGIKKFSEIFRKNVDKI